jgi:hypothetical protein
MSMISHPARTERKRISENPRNPRPENLAAPAGVAAVRRVTYLKNIFIQFLIPVVLQHNLHLF